jgi:hypothetical protein
MPTSCNRPVEPKPPSKVAPEPITVKTSLFTPDSVHQNRRQVRVGNAILRLLRHRLARHCHRWEAVPDAAQRARLNAKSDQHITVKGTRPGNGLK